MIDTKKLRRLVQAAISKMNARDPEFASSVTPLAVLELLDRLEAAEKERAVDEERIADLMADLNRVGHEIDAMRAKVAAMEQQEPVAEWIENRFHRYPQLNWADGYRAVIGEKLYTLPGAKGEEK